MTLHRFCNVRRRTFILHHTTPSLITKLSITHSYTYCITHIDNVVQNTHITSVSFQSLSISGKLLLSEFLICNTNDCQIVNGLLVTSAEGMRLLVSIRLEDVDRKEGIIYPSNNTTCLIFRKRNFHGSL